MTGSARSVQVLAQMRLEMLTAWVWMARTKAAREARLAVLHPAVAMKVIEIGRSLPHYRNHRVDWRSLFQ